MVPEEILVVNDGSLLLQVMGCLLETRGYRLSLTDSPEEALVLLNARSIYLVIVKLNGKQIDRLSVLHMVKELNAHARLIIMADEAHLPAEIFEIEADDYLFLPCRMGEIWRRLSIFLEPSLRKPGISWEKSLAHQVNRQIFRDLGLMCQEMQGQAHFLARGLHLLRRKLNSGLGGEVETTFQETFKRTQTLIGMTEDMVHNFLYGKPAGTPPGIIDLEQDAARPAVSKPGKDFRARAAE